MMTRMIVSEFKGGFDGVECGENGLYLVAECEDVRYVFPWNRNTPRGNLDKYIGKRVMVTVEILED